jgi:hypothetical protein
MGFIFPPTHLGNKQIPINFPPTLETFFSYNFPGGWNFEDNGFVMFNNVRIPRENLLDKFQDVTPDGRYQLKVENEAQRFGLTLGSLSGGRVSISYGAWEKYGKNKEFSKNFQYEKSINNCDPLLCSARTVWIKK